MSIEVEGFSRLRFTDAVIVDGQETFGLFDRPDFLDIRSIDDDQVIEFTVRPPYVGHPDLIANDVYGSPRLDWVVVMFNNPRETLNWPINGSIIRLPSASLVLPEVL